MDRRTFLGVSGSIAVTPSLLANVNSESYISNDWYYFGLGKYLGCSYEHIIVYQELKSEQIFENGQLSIFENCENTVDKIYTRHVIFPTEHILTIKLECAEFKFVCFNLFSDVLKYGVLEGDIICTDDPDVIFAQQSNFPITYENTMEDKGLPELYFHNKKWRLLSITYNPTDVVLPEDSFIGLLDAPTGFIKEKEYREYLRKIKAT